MRRLSLWFNLSTDLNPSQLVSLRPKPVDATPKRGKKVQKRGQDASSVHPASKPVQERGQQHASCSRTGNLEMRPDLPGSVED